MLTDEYRYKVLKLLDDNPQVSQREIAKELGISLGKVNYCLKALVERGLVKAGNFKNSSNKRAYAYLLTSKGLEDKAKVTVEFLQVKIAEYEQIQDEIERLREEVIDNWVQDTGKVAGRADQCIENELRSKAYLRGSKIVK